MMVPGYPEDQRKINTLLRYSAGDAQKGYSITGTYYHDCGTRRQITGAGGHRGPDQPFRFAQSLRRRGRTTGQP